MASPSTHHHKTSTNSAVGIKAAPEDEYLSVCTHLSRQQVMRRRSYHLKQLTKCYRDHYWGLMEELRVRYRDYMWKFGRSPVLEEHNEEEKENAKEEQVRIGIEEGNVESGNGNGNGNGSINGSDCAFLGCRTKAMTLTSFCNLHILSDPKQQLYKPCDAIDRDSTGDVKCGKPVLRSIVPSLCCIHFQKAQQHLIHALKKNGLNVISTNRIAPKFHIIVTEHVRKIQEKRKIASRASKIKVEINN